MPLGLVEGIRKALMEKVWGWERIAWTGRARLMVEGTTPMALKLLKTGRRGVEGPDSARNPFGVCCTENSTGVKFRSPATAAFSRELSLIVWLCRRKGWWLVG